MTACAEGQLHWGLREAVNGLSNRIGVKLRGEACDWGNFADLWFGRLATMAFIAEDLATPMSFCGAMSPVENAGACWHRLASEGRRSQSAQ